MTLRPLTESQRAALNYLLRYPYRASEAPDDPRPYGFAMTTWRSLQRRGAVLFSSSTSGLNFTLTAAGIRAIFPFAYEPLCPP